MKLHKKLFTCLLS